MTRRRLDLASGVRHDVLACALAQRRARADAGLAFQIGVMSMSPTGTQRRRDDGLASRPQGRGAGAVPRPAAPLRRALGGAQLRQDPRWRRALVDALAPARGRSASLDVATGTGHGRRRAARARRTARSSASTRAREMLVRAPARASPASPRGRVELIEGQAERLPFADGELRRAHVHLPAALRRRSAGDAARAGARRASRRADRLARVRRAAVGAGARGVAAVHGRRPAGARAPGLARVGARSGASSARASAASTRAIRWSGSSATGARPGSRTCACGA